MPVLLARNSAAAEKRGRAKIPSPQPPSFLPARAEKFLFLPREARRSEFAIWIFVKKSSDFNQKVPPIVKEKMMEKIKELPRYAFRRSFSEKISPAERAQVENILNEFSFYLDAEEYNLSPERKEKMRDLIAHDIEWIKNNLRMSVANRYPESKKISFFTRKQWSKLLCSSRLAKKRSGEVNPLTGQITATNPENEKDSSNTLNHELFHLFSQRVIFVEFNDEKTRTKRFSETFENAHPMSLGYENLRNGVLSYFNEVVTDMLNVEVLDSYRKTKGGSNYIDGVAIGYIEGIVFFDLLFKKIAEKISGDPKQLRCGIYRGYLEGDRKKLKIFNEAFGKDALKLIADIRSEDDFNYLVESRQIFEFFELDYSEYKKKMRRYWKSKEIDVLEGIKIK